MPHILEPSASPDHRRNSSAERTRKIRIKNRRKLYLDRHPSYFTSPDLELADPLLYDRCIRRFQSAAEREADGKAKGYSGVLEADLYRSEAKIAALHQKDPAHFASSSSPTPGPSFSSRAGEEVAYVRNPDGDIVPEEDDEVPKNKEEGLERWRFEMTLRFLRGEDEEFEYGPVDDSEEWDVLEGREEEEKWFEEEEPSWVDEEDGEGEDGGKKDSETGIQDF